jgi:hypothetical protein
MPDMWIGHVEERNFNKIVTGKPLGKWPFERFK